MTTHLDETRDSNGKVQYRLQPHVLHPHESFRPPATWSNTLDRISVAVFIAVCVTIAGVALVAIGWVLGHALGGVMEA